VGPLRAVGARRARTARRSALSPMGGCRPSDLQARGRLIDIESLVGRHEDILLARALPGRASGQGICPNKTKTLLVLFGVPVKRSFNIPVVRGSGRNGRSQPSDSRSLTTARAPLNFALDAFELQTWHPQLHRRRPALPL